MSWKLFLLLWNFLNFLKWLLLHWSNSSFIFRFLNNSWNALVESLLNLIRLLLNDLFWRWRNQFKRRSHWWLYVFDWTFVKHRLRLLSICLQLQLLRLFEVIICGKVHLKRRQNRNLLMLSEHEIVLWIDWTYWT